MGGVTGGTISAAADLPVVADFATVTGEPPATALVFHLEESYEKRQPTGNQTI
jgi:hypothetical protein